MNEETFEPEGPQTGPVWEEPMAPPFSFDPGPLASRIDHLESALAQTMQTIAHQQALLSTTGYAQQMAADLGNPDAGALLAREMTAIPGLSDAVAKFPVLGDMAKAWAAQRLSQAARQSLAQQESPLPTTLTGENQPTPAGTARQRQLAAELQKSAKELGIDLDDQEAMEVYAGV